MVVTLKYKDVVDQKANLNDLVQEAFGPEGLGVCLIEGVPELIERRERLLRLSTTLSRLDHSDLVKLESKESHYSFGYSLGKEMMNGLPDHSKASFYNNPISNRPVNDNPNYANEYPEYGLDNIWPTSTIPELEIEFMQLGSQIVAIGLALAYHLDKYIAAAHQDLPPHFILSLIERSSTHKARLLHYFANQLSSQLDNWCGTHVDHSVITGLTSAIFFDESKVDFPQVSDSLNLKDAGLFIKKNDAFIKVSIPEACLAFQIGEAAEIASRGLLVATPHCVRGATIKQDSITRNTFAVFIQPNVDAELKPGYTFANFTSDIMKRHY